MGENLILLRVLAYLNLCKLGLGSAAEGAELFELFGVYVSEAVSKSNDEAEDDSA